MKQPVHPLAFALNMIGVIAISLALMQPAEGRADVVSIGYAQLPPGIDEASGLTPSLRDSALFWTHDDNVNLPRSPEGGVPVLFAIDADGRLRARLRIEGVRRRDWEAISGFRQHGQATLVVGDIGDNRGTWPDYRLWLVPEPKIPVGKTVAHLSVLPAGLLRFRYPDGPHDAESMLVDAAENRILIITKRQRPARLYALPLSAAVPIEPHAGWSARRVVRSVEATARKRLVVARPIATLPVLNPTDPIGWLLDPLIGHQVYRPSDMALSRDGRLLVVLTYASIYFFERRTGQSWAEALKRPIDSMSLPFIDQWEGVSFSHDQHSLIVVREGTGPRTMSRLPLPSSLVRP